MKTVTMVVQCKAEIQELMIVDLNSNVERHPCVLHS